MQDYKENSRRAFDRQAPTYDTASFGSHARGLYPILLSQLAQIPRPRVLDSARGQPELLRKLSENGRLPVAELAEKTRTDRKTIERHRKYLVAILLAFTNGFEIIRGHLCQIAPPKGGQTG